MDWFYAKDGQRTGPVSEESLKNFVRTGTIPAETLVWREGMEKWQSFSVIFPPTSKPAPRPGEGACAVCDRIFSTVDLLRYENCFVCAECKPVFFQKLREGVTAKPIEAWRSGKFLVTRIESRLPDRCVKCNEPAQGRTLVRKLNWHPWWALLPALLAPLGFGIIAIFPSRTSVAPILGSAAFVGFIGCVAIAALLRRRADVYIGLCPRHWRQYNRDITMVAAVSIVSVIAFVVGVNIVQGTGALVIAFSFVAIFFAGVVYGMIRTPLVRPRRITKKFIWLRGASPKYLADLPEWTGNG